jgi:RNA polymerase sigma factor (sigma-70 family)
MDGELVRAFRRGDREALARVYQLHIDDVERLARRALLGMRSLSAANLADVVQEIFLRAFSENARASYDGLREYRPYLLMMARNVVADWARRAGREVPSAEVLDALDAGAGTAQAEPDPPPFPPATVSLVAAYVQALPPELRAVHHRRFELAEPQREAAAALGISRQSLRTRERRLIVGLRRELRRAGLGAGAAGGAGASAGAAAAGTPVPVATGLAGAAGTDLHGRRR